MSETPKPKQNLSENFTQLDLSTEGPLLLQLTDSMTRNGNQPIPYPDNSQAPIYDKLISLGYLKKDGDSVALSEQWYKESGGH